jgi:Tfp pilus assembly PilM family ATPase
MFNNFFKKSSFGLYIGDNSLRFIELLSAKNSLKLGRYGEYEIQDKKELEKILASLKKNFGLKTVNFSVANEYMENVQDYFSALNNSKIAIKSFEIEEQSLARVFLKKGERRAHMIVNFGKNQSTIFIISAGVLVYHFVASNAVYFLRDEISKHFLNWHLHKEKGENKPAIEKIIICGNGSNLQEFSEYISVNMRNKTEVANAWINILDTEKNVPEINFEQSFAFAPALGLALKDFIVDPSL